MAQYLEFGKYKRCNMSDETGKQNRRLDWEGVRSSGIYHGPKTDRETDLWNGRVYEPQRDSVKEILRGCGHNGPSAGNRRTRVCSFHSKLSEKTQKAFSVSLYRISFRWMSGLSKLRIADEKEWKSGFRSQFIGSNEINFTVKYCSDCGFMNPWKQSRK